MRFHRLSLAAVLLPLTFAPASASAQVVERDPCFYLREECYARRSDADIRARERVAEAQERARRLADQREDRQVEMRIRAEDARNVRSLAGRDFAYQIRDRQADVVLRNLEAQERTRERNLEMQHRTMQRNLEMQQRARERAQEQREKTLERAHEQRQRTIEREIERAMRTHEAELRRAETQIRAQARYRWP